MPEPDVDITLWPEQGPSRGSRPSLAGWAQLLRDFYPDRLLIEVISTASRGVAVRLRAWFPPGRAALGLTLKRALVRLEGQVGGQVTWREAAMVKLAEWRYFQVHVDEPRLPSGKPLAFSLPLAEVATKIFTLSNLHDADLAYCVSLNRQEAQPQLTRTLVPALAEIQGGGRALRSLLPVLTETIELLRDEGWLATESFGFAPCATQYEDWVGNAVIDSIRGRVPGLGRDMIHLLWSRGAPDDGLGVDLQTFTGRLRRYSYVQDVLAVLGSAPAPALMIPDAPLALGPAPEGQYAFISYAHNDSAFAAELRQTIGGRGVRLWHDEHIGAGAIWDETLEQRISRCDVLIACVSDNYQKSKYCRRELKFADLEGKPILPVAQEKIDWNAGLRLMFQEIQIASLQKDGLDSIIRDLYRMAPSIFA